MDFSDQGGWEAYLLSWDLTTRINQYADDNAFYNWLRSIIQLGLVQDEYQTLDIELSTVDYCSRAIILLAGATAMYSMFLIIKPYNWLT